MKRCEEVRIMSLVVLQCVVTLHPRGICASTHFPCAIDYSEVAYTSFERAVVGGGSRSGGLGRGRWKGGGNERRVVATEWDAGCLVVPAARNHFAVSLGHRGVTTSNSL